MWSIVFLWLLIQTANHDNLDKDKLAISGYDPVSYFSGDPEPGMRSYQSTYVGATYQFASLENKQKFDKNPQEYVPQYGGWCAYALGLAPDKVKIDPETYKVLEGKLYLFYNFKGVNTLQLWNENEKSLLPVADKNWKEIIKK